MLSQWPELVVDGLRARSSSLSSGAARRRVDRALSTLDVHPHEIPRSAVLLIRGMDDPLPGLLVESDRAGASPQWQKALQERLEQLAATARRVVPGWTGTDGGAVYFTDEAELLACLAHDLARGEVGSRWWWRVFVRQLPEGRVRSQTLRTVLGRSPRLLPAILHVLHDGGHCAAVLAAVGADGALALAEQLCAAFELRVLAGWLPTLQASESDASSGNGRNGDGSVTRSDGGRTPASASQPALATRASNLSSHEGRGRAGARRRIDVDPRADADATPGDAAQTTREIDDVIAGVARLGLQPAQSLLLGAALLVVRRPWWFRRVGTQHRFLTALKSEITGRSSRDLSAGAQPAHIGRDEASRPQGGGKRRRAFASSEHEVLTALGDASSSRDAGCDLSDQSPDAQPRSSKTDPEGWDPVSGAPVGSRPRAGPTSGVETTLCHGSKQPTRTELGGVLYLINLMRALGLPECLEPGWGLATHLGSWGLLELLGRALLEMAERPHREDSLWPALAELGSREPGEPLGAGDCGPSSYRMPQRWFDDSVREGSEPLLWSSEGRRLRIWCRSAFVIVERELQAPPTLAQAEQELQLYGLDASRLEPAQWPLAPAAPVCLPDSGAALCWLLARILPYVQHRLAAACAWSDGGAGRIADEILRCPATLHVTATHVDLVASLDDISMAARRAGLDRDPGWLPDLGRVVSFHYE